MVTPHAAQRDLPGSHMCGWVGTKLPRVLPTLALSLLLAADQRVLPVQADLSAVAGLGERSAAGVALYVGVAAGPARPPWGTPFGGLGFEYVQQLGRVPFRASYGLQLRAGYAWSPEGNQPSLMPDVLVYVRLTPFVGSKVGFGDGQVGPGLQPESGPDGVFGFRAGIGLTSPWWTATFLFHRPFAGERGFLGDALNVFTTLLLIPVALLNHVELVAELVGLAGESTFTVRFGTGF